MKYKFSLKIFIAIQNLRKMQYEKNLILIVADKLRKGAATKGVHIDKA